MEHLHSLLRRQVIRHLNLTEALPGELKEFIESVDAAYKQDDDDREMLERSLELSSRELLRANESLKKVLENLEARVEERTRELMEANERLREEIGARERLEKQLRSMALTDALTGLANRNLLTERIGRAAERARRGKGVLFAVLFIDLDNFKMINDTLGHPAGDEVLRTIAGKLNGCVRSMDTVARFGGDEFIVVLEDLESNGAAIGTLRRIMAEISRPMLVSGQQMQVGASIGLVFNTFDGARPEELIRMANLAMRHSKATGKGRYRVYSPKFHKRSVDLLNMVKDLGEAAARDELFLTYQPVLRASSGDLAGFEVLLRWNRPGSGLVMPGKFIPLAEASGKITEIERWKINRALSDMADWRARYPGSQHLTLAMNISTRYLTEEPLDEEIGLLLKAHKVPPECLVLEITETSLMKCDHTILRKLERLREMGARISIDDFGTGYSSMSYIQRLPLDELKVDMAFVRPLGKQPEDREIVRTIVSLAEGLGLTTVAEGVENETQRDILKELGCTLLQGYLFAKPMLKSAIESGWLRALPGFATPDGMVQDWGFPGRSENALAV